MPRYKVLPFPRTRPIRRRTVSPVIPRGALMNGLAPLGYEVGPTGNEALVGSGIRAFGYEGPGSGMAAYGAEFPNSSFLSGFGIPTPPILPQNKVTLLMRADPDAAPGFPGFFQWLANYNPDLFKAAISAVPPSLISATKVGRTGGATLEGIYAGSFKGRANLGDTSDYSGYSASPIQSNFTPALTNMNFDSGSVPAPATISIASTGETSSSPTPTATGVAQLVSALTSAGQSILTGVNQQTLFNTNLARAAAGLPPLTGSGSAITGTAMDPTTLLLIGGGILAVVLVMSMSKG